MAPRQEPDDRTTVSRPIGDYGLLSNGTSTALVSSEGSVDWACLGAFDAASTFARLLDHDRGGCFAIRPAGAVIGRSRRYVGDTMVLETTLHADGGTIELTDALAQEQPAGAPAGAGGARLLRWVRCTDGRVEVDVTIEPRFDYGRTRPWLRRHGARTYSAVGGQDALAVRSDVALDVDRSAVALRARRTLVSGEQFGIVAEAQPAHAVDPCALGTASVREQLDRTLALWRAWSAATQADGPYAAMLRRSALVLQSLCSATTGAMVAAPTTSLPEIPGGGANWDYRYCWLRDATLTLRALSAVGHHEAAGRFRDFVMRAAAGRGEDLQILYGVRGARHVTEVELDLAGWRGSRPVRIGNRAVTQLQLDMFGHLLDAVHLWHSRRADITEDEWSFLTSVVDRAVELRDEPDSGIWELRGAPRHYVHSKVMVWVAIDRGIRLAEEYGFRGADLGRWRAARDAVRRDVERRGVDPRRGNFVQHYETREVDASLLQLALVGFVDASDPRMLATVDAIRDELQAPGGFLRRFRTVSGASDVPGTEGTFLLCSCWLVEVLAMQGHLDEARSLFERVLAVGNDLGLYAEEYDAARDELLGNFPQAFTHLGLIAAEQRLRAGTTPEHAHRRRGGRR